MQNTLKLFGKRIKELRKNRKMTQEQLASAVGLYPKQIGNIETGVCFTTMPVLEKLAQIFEIEIKDLFDINSEKSRKEILSDLRKILPSLSDEKLKIIYKITLT